LVAITFFIPVKVDLYLSRAGARSRTGARIAVDEIVSKSGQKDSWTGFLHKALKVRYKLDMRNDLCLMNRPLLGTWCFALVITFAACSGNPATTFPALPAEVTESTKNPLPDLMAAASAGNPLFSIHCAMCHGSDGKGEGIAGGSLALKPTDLTAGNIVSDSDGKLFLAIKNGIKKVTDHEIWQIVAYTRTLARK
jgi:mono/diheme cytochrome c family protein